MKASYTFHHDDPPGVDHYMLVAPKEEWVTLLLDLKYAVDVPNPVTSKVISELEGWIASR